MIDLLNIRKANAEARKAAAKAQKIALMAKLQATGKLLEDAAIEEAQADRQAVKAKEESKRQARLREAQEAYLEQQQAAGLDFTQFEDCRWFDGLLDHQREGIEFGHVAQRFVLGDDPGLGKTRQAIGWIDAMGAKKVIMVAPGAVAGQFANEIRELAEHREIIDFCNVNKDIRIKRQERLLETDAAVAVFNYEALSTDTTGLVNDILTWRADTLIVDEAHIIRNTNTAKYKQLKKLIGTDTYCGRCQGEVPSLVEVVLGENGKRVGPPRLVPCIHCGWKKGQPVPGSESMTKLDKITHTKSIKNCVFMTGTPILNSPDELYAVFHLARPDLFTTLDDFRNSFTYSDGAGHRYFTQRGLENLMVLIAPVYIAREASTVKMPDGRTLKEFLPDREIEDIMVPILQEDYPEQRTVIDQIKKFSQIQLQSGQKLNIMDQLAQLTRQRQANVFPGGIEVTDFDKETGERVVVFTTADDITESAKMDYILHKFGEHEGERQVVFSQFSSALAELERRFVEAGVRVVRLDGSTPTKLREEVKRNFYRAIGEKPKWDVVLVNYKTGGAGLNLTACTVTHLLDSEWNPGNEEQALHRTYRIGQEEETKVYRYLVPGTIDVRIEAIKRRKKQQVEAFKRGEIAVLKFNKEDEIAEAIKETP